MAPARSSGSFPLRGLFPFAFQKDAPPAPSAVTLAASDALTPGGSSSAPCARAMAASEDGSGCPGARGRSQSDPSALADTAAAAAAYTAAAGESPGNRAGRGREVSFYFVPN